MDRASGQWTRLDLRCRHGDAAVDRRADRRDRESRAVRLLSILNRRNAYRAVNLIHFFPARTVRVGSSGWMSSLQGTPLISTAPALTMRSPSVRDGAIAEQANSFGTLI